MQATGGVYGKANDLGKRARTRLRRFVEEDKADPDGFSEFRDEVLDLWNKLTDGLGAHWLDASRWFQAVDAYSALVRNVSVLGARRVTIGTCVTGTVASWFAISLFRWLHDVRNVVPLLFLRDQLWFLENPSAVSPYALLFEDLKRGLGIDSERYFSLAAALLPDAEKEQRDDLAKEISAWCDRTIEPQIYTLIERIEKPLEELGHGDLAKIFRSGVVSIRFGKALEAWGTEIGCYRPGETIRSAMAGTLEALALGESRLDFIPSPRFLNYVEDYFRTEYQSDFWNGIQAPGERERALSATASINGIVTSILGEICDPEVRLPGAADLEALAVPLRYRCGPGYSVLENAAMRIAMDSSDEAAVKALHSRRTLEQLAATPYALSKPWHAYIAGLRSGSVQALSHLDSRAALEWAKEYRRKDRVDRWRVWGRYRRTCLMIACAFGDGALVERLLADGADPSLVSEPRGRDLGDGATALLLAVQGYAERVDVRVSADRTERRSIAFRVLETIGNDERTINRTTFIRNVSPLSLAIDDGDAELAAALVRAGGDLERGIGSDALGPLYYSIGAYFNFELARRLGAVGFTKWLERKGPDLDPTRMALPYPLAGSFLPRRISVRDFHNALPPAVRQHFGESAFAGLSLDSRTPGERLAVILALLDLGAAPDRLQSNGRYPLDMADELERETGDASVRLLLEARGAVKRAI